jgi:hypothetical protein
VVVNGAWNLVVGVWENRVGWVNLDCWKVELGVKVRVVGDGGGCRDGGIPKNFTFNNIRFFQFFSNFFMIAELQKNFAYQLHTPNLKCIQNFFNSFFSSKMREISLLICIYLNLFQQFFSFFQVEHPPRNQKSSLFVGVKQPRSYLSISCFRRHTQYITKESNKVEG